MFLIEVKRCLVLDLEVILTVLSLWQGLGFLKKIGATDNRS